MCFVSSQVSLEWFRLLSVWLGRLCARPSGVLVSPRGCSRASEVPRASEPLGPLAR